MSQNESYEERRQFKRVDQKIKVGYKLISSTTEIDEIKQKLSKNSSETINLSLGGMQITEGAELVSGQILRVEFHPEGKDKPVITFAEVKWARPDGKNKEFRTGLEFLVLKEEDREYLSKLIENK